MIKISYLGPIGSNSHNAFEYYTKQKNIKNYKEIATSTIEDAIICLEEKKVDLAIVPIENSVEGSVNVTLDRLALNSELNICDQLLLPIQHVLLTSNINQPVTSIASHPQAIAQCRKFLKTNYPNAKIIYTNSTSQAAKLTLDSEGEICSICSPAILNLYNLNVISRNIQDFKNNCTRFVILNSNNENLSYSDECAKLSILFSTSNTSGSLFEVLKIFKDLNINLTKIESRPAKNVFGQYIFFIDMEIEKNKNVIKKIETELSKKTNFYRILGVYASYSKLENF